MFIHCIPPTFSLFETSGRKVPEVAAPSELRNFSNDGAAKNDLAVVIQSDRPPALLRALMIALYDADSPQGFAGEDECLAADLDERHFPHAVDHIEDVRAGRQENLGVRHEC